MSEPLPPRVGKFRSLNSANTHIGELRDELEELRDKIDELLGDLSRAQDAYADACEEVGNLKKELKLHASGFGMAQLKEEGQPVTYSPYNDNPPPSGSYPGPADKPPSLWRRIKWRIWSRGS